MRFTNWRTNSVWVCVALCLQPVRTTVPAYAQENVTRLNITVTEGEGAINNTRQRNARGLAVVVKDQNDKPVNNASVVFTAPADGPGGAFANGSKMMAVTTDAEGRASVAGFRPNGVDGKMAILVNASYRGRTANAVITQFNMAVPGTRGKGGGKLAVILVLVGGAAAGGAAMALRSNKSNSPAAAATVPPIGITPGTGTISGPQ